MFEALLAIAIVFGTLRFTLPVEGKVEKKDVFKDLAHVFVGFAFGYAACTEDWVYWSIPVGLTILGVVAFLVRKGK